MRTFTKTASFALVALLAATTAACSSGGDETVQPTPSDAADAPAADDQSSDDDTDVSVPGSGDVAVPIAKFAAAGEGDPGTIGPACGDNEDRGDGIFRFTAPAGYEWQGMGGGSGAAEFTITDGDTTIQIDSYGAEEEYEADSDLEDLGESGTTVDIDDETFEVHEVTMEDEPGFGIFGIEYLSPVPMVDALIGGVVVSSRDVELTVDQAVEILETVRAERCAVVAEAQIWGPAAGVQLVPHFEPDPLDKTYPDQPQPAYTPGDSVVNTYTEEQVAYLLPLPEDVSVCVAPLAQEAAADDLVLDRTILSPTGTGKEQLEELVAEC